MRWKRQQHSVQSVGFAKVIDNYLNCLRTHSPNFDGCLMTALSSRCESECNGEGKWVMSIIELNGQLLPYNVIYKLC